MDASHKINSTTIDDEDIPKDILDFKFLFSNESLQEKARKIAEALNLFTRCSSCFLIGIFFILALLVRYDINFEEVLPQPFTQRFTEIYTHIYNIYRNCDKNLTCPDCTHRVSLILWEFLQSFNRDFIDPPYGFIQVTVVILVFLQKSWNGCDNCIRQLGGLRAPNFKIKCCLKTMSEGLN